MKFDRMPNFGRHRKFLKSHSSFDRIKPTPTSTELTSFLFFLFCGFVSFFSSVELLFLFAVYFFSWSVQTHVPKNRMEHTHLPLSLSISVTLYLSLFLPFTIYLSRDTTADRFNGYFRLRRSG